MPAPFVCLELIMPAKSSTAGRAAASGESPVQPAARNQRPRDPKRRGEIGEVEAICGRESERSDDGSPQPKSRAPRGTSLSRPRDPKRRGEIGEAAFLAKASAMGFGVAKPWGDSDRYDLIVDVNGRLLKVQVKSAHCVCAQPGGGYHIRAGPHQRVPYRADEIDLLVAYIVPEDIWYIFPHGAFSKMKSMRLFPYRGKKMSKFERYREAWHAFHETK